MEGIRLRPGQRRKSIARNALVRKQEGFDNPEHMLTFAELGLRPDRHMFARNFSHLRYSNYKHQFKSTETDNASETDDNSRSSFDHSVSSKRSYRPSSGYTYISSQNNASSAEKRETEYTVKDNDIKQHKSVKYENERVPDISEDEENKKVRDIKRDQGPNDRKIKDDIPEEKYQNLSEFQVVQGKRGDDVPTNENAMRLCDETLTKDGNITKDIEGRTDTEDTITDGNDQSQIVELQVEGVRKASIKLPPISFRSIGRRQTELSLVSRKQARDSLAQEDSFSTGDSTHEPTYYRSEVASSLSSEVSLSFIRSDSTSSDGEPRVLNISDSEEFDTDLEDEDFGRDRIPENDVNVGRTMYLRTCERLGKPPQKYILKSLAERSMSLRNRSLGKDGIAPLCAALKENIRVERINLDGTDITDEGIANVTDMLLENLTISYMSLANNSLGLKASQLISHVLVTTKYLTHLNLSGNKMKDDAGYYISSAMGGNSSITHLDLGYNDFGERGGIFISSGLVRNNKIVFLSLRWNKICGKGAVAIFQALMLNNTIEVLDFSWNGMGYNGAVAMSKCLKTNRGLRTLDVSCNRIDHRCTTLLAAGLRSNSSLRQLKVACNPLTTSGCMDILAAVATEDSSIGFLDCSEIPVLGEADLLAATISRRRKFLFIHGGIVPTHDTVGQKLGRELNPMLRIIEYLRLLGLRPLELLKSFDKTSSFELPRQEFVAQIKKIGVKLHTFEIEALANSISGKGYNKNVINYRKLSMAVREVVQAERERKMREREEYIQMKKQHEKILKRTQLEIDSNASAARVLSDLDSLRVASFNASSLMMTSRDSLASSKASGALTSNVNMCSPLESQTRRVSFAVSKTRKPKKIARRKRPVNRN